MSAMGAMDRKEIAARRARAIRTAWLLAAVAAVIFVAFVLSGVLNT